MASNGSVDQVKIKVLVNNYVDPALQTEDKFKDFVIQPERSAGTCLGDYGLTLAVELIKDETSHHILLDAGGVNGTIIKNANTFRINLESFEKIILSHGHIDHFGGLFKVLEQIQETELIISPNTLNQKYMLTKDLTGKRIDLQTVNIRALRKQGQIFELPLLKEKLLQKFMQGKNIILNKETSKPIQLYDGCWLSGEIEIMNAAEILPGFLYKKGDSFYEDDFRDELTLYINLKDKGLVILTGCCHCGVTNTIQHAKKVTGVKKIYALIGGLHQIWSDTETTTQVIDNLKSENLTILCPMHCSGIDFIAKCLVKIPDKTVIGCVGTFFEL